MKRRFKGIWIPAELWLCAELSAQEKCLVAEVDSLNAEDKGCFATNGYLAQFFGLSISRMAALIGDLNKRGWLRVELSNGNERAMFPGEKWAELSHTGNSNPPPTGNSIPPLLIPVSPNIERTKKDNTGELFNSENFQSLPPNNGTEKRQSKSVVERLKREATAEAILASYPRKSGNYGRDKLATMRALKRVDSAALLQSVRDYASYIAATKTEAKFVLVAANFMDRERYTEDWKSVAKAANVPTSGRPAEKKEVKAMPSFEERMRGINNRDNGK